MAKTWFITGASRGLGLEVARAALEAGDDVVATARQPEQVRDSLSEHHDRLLSIALDVTDNTSVNGAVEAALGRFGHLDVLVNNAGYGQLGAFEELSTTAIEQQFLTNVFGAFDITRAILPGMRDRRSGHIITIASLTGVIGLDGSSIYCAAKFAVAGWSESLSRELGRFGIAATAVYPGQFRTDFLDASSVGHGDLDIEDYREVATARRQSLDTTNHTQRGDPRKFGPLIVSLANSVEPPARIAVGTDAVAAFEQRAEELAQSVRDWRTLSESTDFT